MVVFSLAQRISTSYIIHAHTRAGSGPVQADQSKRTSRADQSSVRTYVRKRVQEAKTCRRLYTQAQRTILRFVTLTRVVLDEVAIIYDRKQYLSLPCPLSIS